MGLVRFQQLKQCRLILGAVILLHPLFMRLILFGLGFLMFIVTLMSCNRIVGYLVLQNTAIFKIEESRSLVTFEKLQLK